MDKRNFYMVQVDVAYGDAGSQKSAYLPYAVALLSAFAMSDAEIQENYELKRLIFLREDVEEAVAAMENPWFVGFSNYVWNTEYNKRLAKRVKEAYPNCHIIFGGHNVPPNNNFLEDYPYIDFLLHGEGEIPFQLLLKELLREQPDFASLPSLSYRVTPAENHKTPVLIPTGLEYPSPYLEGYLDSLFDAYPSIKFSAILETSRGCPYQCAYCDWALLKSKIRQFPIERVHAEIRWMSEHKIEYIWGADSNFGLFPRDEQIVDYMLECKAHNGYPEKIRINYAKNNEDTVFNIVKKLNESESSKFGSTLSFQSMSPTVLENIGRKNMDFEHFKSLMLRYNDEKIRTYSELILGLPGETYESFCEGIEILLDAGQHNAIEYYRCLLLPNSAMAAPDFMAKHGIEAKKIIHPQVHAYISDAATDEMFEVVVRTDTMDKEAMIRANQFAIMVQAMHGGGLLRYFAIYLHLEKKHGYAAFYNDFLDYCAAQTQGVLHKVYQENRRHNARVMYEGVLEPLHHPELSDIIWLPDEYVALAYIYRLEQFYQEVEPFLRQYFEDEALFEDLFRFQREMIRHPGVHEKALSLRHDFFPYFSAVYVGEYHPLEKKNLRVTVHDCDVPDDWEKYSRFLVWYGRMGGKTLYDETMLRIWEES